MTTKKQAAWFQPKADAIVACFRGESADDFRDLFSRTRNRTDKWWTVGEMCELIRISWLNRRLVEGFGIVYFDLLPRRAQYAIVKRVVRDRETWDTCLGSDDGREVRVYRLR